MAKATTKLNAEDENDGEEVAFISPVWSWVG
jgi:hypothetical protein